MVIEQSNEIRTTKLLYDIQSNPMIQDYMNRICNDMHGLMQAFALEISMKDVNYQVTSDYWGNPNPVVISNTKTNTIPDHIPNVILAKLQNVHDVVADTTVVENNSTITQKEIGKLSDIAYNTNPVYYTPITIPCGLYRTSNIPNTATYTAVFNELMHISSRGNVRDTGWVLPTQVLSVLSEGNARERCFMLSNILFKDPNSTLMCWLLSPERSLAPSSINEAVVRDYRDKIYNIVCKRHTNGGRETTHHVRKMLCGKHTQRNKKIRFPRARDDRVYYQMRCNTIVPQLSIRENFLLDTYIRCNNGYMPWRTGLMYWQLKENSSFLTIAKKRNQSVVSGFSGHTDAMLTFLQIFRSYNVKFTTLVCILWLVGSQHHSVFEVLATASDYGLFYTNEDAIEYATELLRSLD